jgi:hypothetical protein
MELIKYVTTVLISDHQGGTILLYWPEVNFSLKCKNAARYIQGH